MTEEVCRKGRWCRHCQKIVYSTAQEIKDHAALCKRATQAGLILPEGIIST
jgi:hypothetical protein